MGKCQTAKQRMILLLILLNHVLLYMERELYVIGNRHHTPDVVFEFPGLNKVPRTNTDCNVRTTSSQT